MSIQFTQQARYGVVPTPTDSWAQCCSQNLCQRDQQVAHAQSVLDRVTLSPGVPELNLFAENGSALDQVINDHDVAASMRANFGERSPLNAFVFRPRNLTGCGHFPETRATERDSSPRPTRQAPLRVKTGLTVKPQRQRNSVSCGQTSVAVSVNALTGKRLTDRDIDLRYGFGLLNALNSESKSAGYRWRDGGNFQAKNWPTLEKKLNQEKTPVLMGLNGPEFSPSGRGHIVTLLGLDGVKVRYMDPADGKVKVTTKEAIEKAAPHPDGKFFFYASKIPGR